jgi:hypothetical protein
MTISQILIGMGWEICVIRVETETETETETEMETEMEMEMGMEMGMETPQPVNRK